MTEAAKRVREGDLSQRIPVPDMNQSSDEIVTLATTFNSMILQLRGNIENLKQQADELRKSEEKNRAMINAMPDIIFRHSRDGIYLDAKIPDGISLIGTDSDL